MEVIEDKTILEELLERSEEQNISNRIDKAYNLISQGRWDDADEIFDSILTDSPDNTDAKLGKRIVERQREIYRRLDTLGARAHSLTEGQEIKKDTPIRSRVGLWVLLALVLLAAGVAVVTMTGQINIGDNPVFTPSPTVEVSPTAEPAPTESAEPSALPTEPLPTQDQPQTTDAPVVTPPPSTPSPQGTPTPSTPSPQKTPTPSTPKPTAKPTPAPTPKPTAKPKPTTPPAPTPPPPPEF